MRCANYVCLLQVQELCVMKAQTLAQKAAIEEYQGLMQA